MQAPTVPEAWIAANNRMIYNAMQATNALGLKIPEDIALAAFGDFEWSDYFEPRITTLVQSCNTIGIQAVELLKQRIKNPTMPAQRIEVDSELIIRESCGEKRGDLSKIHKNQ